jgi:hypothetical protein
MYRSSCRLPSPKSVCGCIRRTLGSLKKFTHFINSKLIPTLSKKQKHLRFFGIVQAGYRDVLQNMPQPTSPYDLAPLALTPPATEETPSTPTPHHQSLNDVPPSRATPFANNRFTTVSTSFAPPSPTRKKQGKRLADEEGEISATPKKRKGF